MTEIWKDVVGYEGLYQVSNLGRVKSLARITYSGRNYSHETVTSDLILYKKTDKDGYKSVRLSLKGKASDKRVHRLVLMSFCTTENTNLLVNHKNGIVHDNRVENLEWCDSRYNRLHYLYELNGKSKLNTSGLNKPMPIYSISENGDIINYKSFRYAEIITGNDRRKIKNAINSNVYLNGCLWRYLT